MEKDCQCIMHEGPHWLYMDFLDRERNLSLLERFVRSIETRNAEDFVLAHYAWMQAEEARLREKRYYMEMEDRERGEPGSYPYDLLGIDEHVAAMEEKRRDLMERLKRVAPEEIHA